MKSSLASLFASTRKRVILDGGLATRLEELGADLSTDLWSARLLHSHPKLIAHVHKEYAAVGANVCTTATYQCSVPSIMKCLSLGRLEAENLIRSSVQLARDGIKIAQCELSGEMDPQMPRGEVQGPEEMKQRPIIIAGSIGSYGACLADGSEYTPNFSATMSVDNLVEWHSRRVDLLLEEGVDILAMETIPCRIEVIALCKLLHERPNARAWISLACCNSKNLNSGEAIRDAIADVERYDTAMQVEAVGVNCTAPRYVNDLIQQIQSVTSGDVIVYPNAGEGWDTSVGNWVPDPSGSDLRSGREGELMFGALGQEWFSAGASGVGGCCRIGPGHISELRRTVDYRSKL